MEKQGFSNVTDAQVPFFASSSSIHVASLPPFQIFRSHTQKSHHKNGKPQRHSSMTAGNAKEEEEQIFIIIAIYTLASKI